MKKYWYQYTVYYCPACGGDKTYKERVYEKPLNRYVEVVTYDYCMERNCR